MLDHEPHLTNLKEIELGPRDLLAMPKVKRLHRVCREAIARARETLVTAILEQEPVPEDGWLN